MNKFVLLLLLFGLVQVTLTQKSSKEESAEQKDLEWVDNPEIELRQCFSKMIKI